MAFPLEASHQERRWLVLARDGRHSWLGRNSDPTPEELGRMEGSLLSKAEAAFLAISEGDYWNAEGNFTLFLVRPLAGAPAADWDIAREAFLSARAEKLKSLS